MPEMTLCFFVMPRQCTEKSHIYNLPLPHKAPPSKVMQAPLQCPPAREARYTTAPAISSGIPSLIFGFMAAIASAPPCISIKPLAILLGKNPGAIALHMICRGPSSTARLRVRCMTAAFEAEYPYVPLSPRLPTPSPAIDAVTMTREVLSSVAFFCRRGANLRRFPTLVCNAYRVLRSYEALLGNYSWESRRFNVQSDSIEHTLHI